MNTTENQGNINKQKAILKQKYAKLTNNDTLLIDGKREEILSNLQIKLGKTKEELKNIIESL